jgi:hypothetical protein
MHNQIQEFFREGYRRPAPGWFIGLCRLAFGLMWLYSARGNVPPSFGSETDTGLWYWTQQGIQHTAFSWHRALLENVVLPNLVPFGWLSFLLQLSIGFFLVAGLFTRIFSAAGLLLSLCLAIGLAGRPTGEGPMAFILAALFQLLFITTNAGLNWGLDQMLLEKLANSPLRRTSWGRRLMKIL